MVEKMIKNSGSYWSVSYVPAAFDLKASERRRIANERFTTLKARYGRADWRFPFSQKDQADKHAAKIEAESGVPMRANEAVDLHLF